MMTQETTVNSNGQTVYKSRWGYHPCDYETFLKLKELNKLFEKSKQDAKNWYRWARKQEHNRRGSEPQIDPRFCELPEKPPSVVWMDAPPNGPFQLRDGSGYAYFPDNHLKSVVVRHHDIAEAYRRARTPVSSPDAVPSLGVPVGKIDAMLNDSE